MQPKSTKIISIILLFFMVICLSSCDKVPQVTEYCSHEVVIDKAVPATCTETGLTEGSHCSLCNTVLVKQQVIPAEGHSSEEYDFDIENHYGYCLKCGNRFTEKHDMDPETKKCSKCDFETVTPPPFPSGYITKEHTTIETEHFICEIDADTYIIDNLEYYLETLFDALEVVSGLSFNTAELGKILVEVKKAQAVDGYVSETHIAYAYFNRIVISTGDLFISGGHAIAHELSHILQNHNCGWNFRRILPEGFAVYTTYKVTKYMEENYPDIAYALEAAENNMRNEKISAEGYKELYSKPLSYWQENLLPHAMSSDYAIGFRLMKYLDSVYNDYSSWITEYQKVNPFTPDVSDDRLDIREINRVLPMTYGEYVEANFYTWLKRNEGFFEEKPDNTTDRTHLSYINIYPKYNYRLSAMCFEGFEYQDIYFNIDQLRRYITEYKGDKLGNFRFFFGALEPTTIKLYDSEGNLIAKHFSETAVGTYSLEGVGFIQFVGRGTIMRFNISGFASIE